MKQTVNIELGERTIELETGRLAKQAGGAVIVRCGDTVVLVTATAADKPREGIDFFPLTVDYREYTYAAGRIPGGYIKREGRPSEKEVLTSRLIDRPIRPLFADGFRNETQVIAFVLSAESDFDPSMLALVGASAALSISDIPFLYPIGAVRVGRVDGNWVLNPSYPQLDEGDLNIVVAGAEEGLVMVESSASDASEADMVAAMRVGHEGCRTIIKGIHELVEKAGKTKREVEPPSFNEEGYNAFAEKWSTALTEAQDTSKVDKLESQASVSSLKKECVADAGDDEAKAKEAGKFFNKLKESLFRQSILENKRRLDGRAFDQIRQLTCEVSELPRTHGSAVFTRGETQALATVTLATRDEGQRQERLENPDTQKTFMVHYNFPPFSVGEVSFLRGAGR